MRKPRFIVSYGPAAVLLRWEATIDPAVSLSVHAYAAELSTYSGILECVPAYAELLVCFDADKLDGYRVRELCFATDPEARTLPEPTLHEIPVCYGGAYGPDAETVCASTGLDLTALIDLHTAPTYHVYQMGYQPGFAFLGPTDERLEVPRLPSPRPKVPAGSVGLAGRQTGVYPITAPGGWRLIGRTPGGGGRQYVPDWRAGDRVKFRAITPAAFEKIRASSPTPEPTNSPADSSLTLTALTTSPTTLTDHGRPGRRAGAYPRGGPADADAALLAREMLASPANQPLLEFAYHPGRWLLRGKGSFVLTGADFDWTLDGRKLRRYRVHQLDGDEAVLTGRMPEDGARGYLGVAGDWKLPRTLGSVEAPDVRYLAKGWSVGIDARVRPASKFPISRDGQPSPLHLLVHPGPEWNLLTPAEQRALLTAEWTVSTTSTRQGLQLCAPGYRSPTLPELLSGPVLPGTVQLTPKGPILLGPMAQTLGGYPRVLCVDSGAMLGRAYQLSFSSKLIFQIV